MRALFFVMIFGLILGVTTSLHAEEAKPATAPAQAVAEAVEAVEAPGAAAAEVAEKVAAEVAGEAADETVDETDAEATGEADEKSATEEAKKDASASYFIRRFGDAEIIALLDAAGINDGPIDILIGATEEDLARAREKDALKTSINVFIAKMGGKTILFDTGYPIAKTGGILPALEQAGIAPDAIDAVVITHFHQDHIGGLLKDGKAVYPNAELYIPEAEVNRWSDAGTEFLLVYGVRTNAFKAGKEILPGVTAVAAYGHTPGHTIYRLDTGAEKVLIIGDLIHLPGVQLANPRLAVTYDVDPVRAVAARKRAFDMAIAEGLTVVGMHIPFPGMGTLEHAGAGYAFTEIER